MRGRKPAGCFICATASAIKRRCWRLTLSGRCATENQSTSVFSSSARKGSASSGTERRMEVSMNKHSSPRSEEHTSELQSRGHLVCRRLLEKKKQIQEHRRRE